MPTVNIQNRVRNYDFTVVVIPDTQNYSEKIPDIYHAQTRWIAENAARENIVFATHVGDIVQFGDRLSEWDVALPAMKTLIGTVPFGVVAGNHDYDEGKDPNCPLVNYRRRFGQEYFGKIPTAKEFGPEDLSAAHIFKATGREILSLHLEPDPRDTTIDWARRMAAKYPKLPIMVTTHIYMSDETDTRDIKPYSRRDGNSPEDLFQKFIRKTPRVFLVQCGHWWTKGGEATQISTNEYGGRVVELLSDYQGRANGGNGWLRMLRFDLKNGLLHTQTYSPTLNRFERDADSEMTLPLTIDDPIAPEPITLRP